MSIESLISDGRIAFDALMTDACIITKPGVGPAVINEATGAYTYPARVPVYAGPCRIQVKADINSNVVETNAGDREWTYLTAQLQLSVRTPPGATGSVDAVDVDHICEVTAAPHSPSLVGALFNIQGTYHKSQAVYQRFRVHEVVA